MGACVRALKHVSIGQKHNGGARQESRRFTPCGVGFGPECDQEDEAGVRFDKICQSLSVIVDGFALDV